MSFADDSEIGTREYYIKKVEELSFRNVQMLATLQLVYRKHCLNDEDVGWSELTSILGNILPEVMGDEEFQTWLETKPWKGRNDELSKV